MNIDNMTIEELRNELKRKTTKCIENFTTNGVEFKEGEYYFFEFDYKEEWYYIEYTKGKNILIYDFDAEQYFKFPKEGD